VIGVNDNVKTGNGGKLEFSGFDASHGQFFPCLGRVSLLGGIDGLLELFKSDEAGSDFSVVLGCNKEDFRSFVELLVVASVTNALVVNGVWSRDEVLDVIGLIDLGVREDEGVVNVGDLNVFTGHEEILDEVIPLLKSFGLGDDLEVRGVVLGFNVAFNGFRDHGAI
jgi:hypothetical protein